MANKFLPTRRDILRVGGLTLTGCSLPLLAPSFNARAEKKVSPRGTAEYCLFLMLEGGASHVDTFDVKESKWQPEDLDFRSVNPDGKLSRNPFPKMAEHLRKGTLVRSLAAWVPG